MKSVSVPISIGELLDKITILEIKMTRISDSQKLLNVEKELGQLRAIAESLQLGAEDLQLVDALREVNEVIWQVEDDVRNCEQQQDFGNRFVELARSVYIQNDKRAKLKKKLNENTDSELVEEKSYTDYLAANVPSLP